MKTLRFKLPDGRVVEVKAGAVQGEATHVVELPGRRLELSYEIGHDGMGWLLHDGRRHAFCVLQEAGRIEVWLDGRVRTFELLQRTAQRSGATEHAGASEVLSAPMPGSILQVLITEGQGFCADQPLVIMESMKMEMTLSVPHAGVARAVRCAAGGRVQRGAELIILGAADAGDELARQGAHRRSRAARRLAERA